MVHGHHCMCQLFFWKSMAGDGRYKGCHGEATYDSVVCTTLEKSCFACYCSIAEEEFSRFTYCKTFWAKYLIQVMNNPTAVAVTVCGHYTWQNAALLLQTITSCLSCLFWPDHYLKGSLSSTHMSVLPNCHSLCHLHRSIATNDHHSNLKCALIRKCDWLLTMHVKGQHVTDVSVCV